MRKMHTDGFFNQTPKLDTIVIEKKFFCLFFSARLYGSCNRPQVFARKSYKILFIGDSEKHIGVEMMCDYFCKKIVVQ